MLLTSDLLAPPCRLTGCRSQLIEEVCWRLLWRMQSRTSHHAKVPAVTERPHCLTTPKHRL